MAVTKAELNQELILRGVVHAIETQIDELLHRRYVIEKLHPVYISEDELGNSDINLGNLEILDILRDRYADWIVDIEIENTTGRRSLVFK